MPYPACPDFQLEQDVAQGVVFARHTGYTTAGIPIVSVKPEPLCAPPPGSTGLFRLRHYAYTDTFGFAKMCYALTCCNEVDDRPRVETACLPGVGITRKLIGHVYERGANCPSAAGQEFLLEYSGDPLLPGGLPFGHSTDPDCPTCVGDASGDGCATPCCGGYWSGSFSLSGGSFTVIICCHPDPTPGPPVFRMFIQSSCGGGFCLCKDCTPSCLDPLFLGSTFSIPGECCGCAREPADIHVAIAGNCHPVVTARHVGYTAAGIPIVAMQHCLPNMSSAAKVCAPRCGLTADVTLVSGPSCCIVGSFPMNPQPGGPPFLWVAEGLGPPGCCCSLSMSCVGEVDEEGHLTGRAILTACFSCLRPATEDCSGSVDSCASVILDPDDLSGLDVTFGPICIGGAGPCPPPTCCNGTCVLVHITAS